MWNTNGEAQERGRTSQGTQEICKVARAPRTFSRRWPHCVSPWLKVLVAAPYSHTSSQTGVVQLGHQSACDGLVIHTPASSRARSEREEPPERESWALLTKDHPLGWRPQELLVINGHINPVEHDSLIIVTFFTFIRIISYYINIYFSLMGCEMSWVMFMVGRGVGGWEQWGRGRGTCHGEPVASR